MLSAGDGGVPEGMSVYDNAMLEFGSEMGSPDARHSSSQGATSSGGHPAADGRVAVADDMEAQWQHADRVSPCLEPLEYMH